MEATVPLLDITSANATMVMIVEDLYPAGVPITNFSTDQMIDGDEHEYAQAWTAAWLRALCLIRGT